MQNVLIFFVILLVPLIAAFNIILIVNKNKKIENKNCGYDSARKVLDENDLKNMYIVEVRNVGDHYDNNQKVIRLSSDSYHGETLSGVVAGVYFSSLAILDKEEYGLFKSMSLINPIMKFINYIAYILFIVSICLQDYNMVMIAAVLLACSVIFQLCMLPVGIKASDRAMDYLKEYKLVDKKDMDGAENMLRVMSFNSLSYIVMCLVDLLRSVINRGN